MNIQERLSELGRAGVEFDVQRIDSHVKHYKCDLIIPLDNEDLELIGVPEGYNVGSSTKKIAAITHGKPTKYYTLLISELGDVRLAYLAIESDSGEKTQEVQELKIEIQRHVIIDQERGYLYQFMMPHVKYLAQAA